MLTVAGLKLAAEFLAEQGVGGSVGAGTLAEAGNSALRGPVSRSV